jgi:thiol-disulfide isomerase/thioredoxin
MSRWAAIAAAITAVGLLGACGQGGSAARPAADHDDAPGFAGPPAPALDLPDLGGAVVRLDQLRGVPVIVNFWATWCEPCKREMPSLVQLNARLSGRGLRILAVSIDANKADVQRYLERTDFPLQVLLDPTKGASERFGVTTVPSTFILDDEGRVVERVDGAADWTSPNLLGILEKLLARGRRGGVI